MYQVVLLPIFHLFSRLGILGESFATLGICHARKQFRGFSGSSGLVPEATQHGDVICILAGAEIPFVLRPAGGRYQLIGDGYIERGPDNLIGCDPSNVQTFTIR